MAAETGTPNTRSSPCYRKADQASRVRGKAPCQLFDDRERAQGIVLAREDEHWTCHAAQQGPRAEARGLVAEEMQIDL